MDRILTLILLCEELFSYGIPKVIGAPFSGVPLVLLSIYIIRSYRFKLPLIYQFLITIILLFALWLLAFSTGLLPVEVIHLVLFLCGLVIGLSSFELPIKGSRVFTFGLIAVSVSLSLSLIGIDIFTLLVNTLPNRPSGLYTEPSHLAYYVVILFLYARKARPENLVIDSFWALLSLSIAYSITSALLSVVVIIPIFVKIKSIWLKISVSLALISLLVLLSSSDYVSNRNVFDSSKHSGPSVLFLLTGYDIVLEQSKSSLVSGYGSGNFIDVYERMDSADKIPVELKTKDGPFLISKVVIEYSSIIALLLVLLILFKIIQCSAWSVGYVLLQYFFVRGWGFSPIIFLALLMLPNPAIDCRVHNTAIRP